LFLGVAPVSREFEDHYHVLIVRKQRLSPIEERIVMAWVESTAPTDPERVTYVSRVSGADVETVRTALNDVRIQQAILYEQSRLEHETGIDVTNVLRMAGRMLYYDVALLADPKTGQPVPLHQLPEEIRAAIQGIKVTTKDDVTTYEYKMVDKVGTLDKVMKHLGLFAKDNAQIADPIRRLLDEVYRKDTRIPIRQYEEGVIDLPTNVPAVGVESIESVDVPTTYHNKYAH
jgi:hypothetical protein